MKAHPMQQFHDMLKDIRALGIRRPNRTGVDSYFVPGYMLQFDMIDGFPAITTKKLAFKSMVGELFGIFRGYEWAHQFRDIGCKVWDANANKTAAWLQSPYRLRDDHLGRIYGSQWTDWRDWREAHSAAEAQSFIDRGYELIAEDAARNTWVVRRGINQLEEALKLILTDPNNRRIIVNGWRPDEHDQGALPACHVAYQFMVANGELHMTLWQRSFDTFLAYNVSEGALFLEVMARLAGLKARTFTHFISDSHIYVSHFDAVDELLSREHYPQPKLVISDRIEPVTVDEIKGVFARIEPEDVWLENYQHHPAIKAEMAA